jgi:putative NIF3 family GTP cyclohydrolase 1 type 2
MMKTKEIFDLAIKMGIKNDPRRKSGVAELLRQNKKEYKELPKNKQAEYDKEKFVNPYSDSRYLCGSKSAKVKRVLVGVDIGVEEVLLAKELEKQGKKIDMIIAHHPEGGALADLHEVMDIQTAVLAKAGVPENIGEGVLKERLEQVWRSVSSVNHYKSVMAAELLDIPMVCLHTPADNCVWNFVDRFISAKKPKTVGEIVEKLKEIPEYKKAVKLHAGPRIFAGDEKSRAGQIVVSGMTGGTSGSSQVYERMSHFGIGTEIAMHIREEDRDEAVKHYINVVIAGHIASDSLGLNIIMDELEKKGVEIVPCSGYIRHSRKKG